VNNVIKNKENVNNVIKNKENINNVIKNKEINATAISANTNNYNRENLNREENEKYYCEVISDHCTLIHFKEATDWDEILKDQKEMRELELELIRQGKLLPIDLSDDLGDDPVPTIHRRLTKKKTTKHKQYQRK